MTYRIFISSVQREFERERKVLADYSCQALLGGISVNLLRFEQLAANGMLPSFASMPRMHGTEAKL